jgi:hypothetical protein
MDRSQRYVPVILLLDKGASADRSDVMNWFDNSRFSTYEASNVFEALDELSDFTIKERPDVVLLNVENENELSLMRDISGMEDLAIMALSSGSSIVATDGCFRGNLGQLATHLDKLIPNTSAGNNN